ncbi:MAG TPA: ABC transporter substrate-binding protein [Burkholderiaceae bacterium]|jgi:peptide/nickel transport system substrate-binding protein
MKRFVIAVCLCLGAIAQAQTLHWAGQGDLQTLDPHSQNESMTNMINAEVYEFLVGRDRDFKLAPQLALSWTRINPLLWRIKLRPGVKFHDGTPFTADDVVFSFERAKALTSQLATYANATGTAKKVDALTVDFQLTNFDPIFPEHLTAINVMSKRWCEEHHVVRPLDRKSGEESYATFNANGTGPLILVSRQPGIKTSYKRNPNWWGEYSGNVQAVEFTPVANDATRVAALISGALDFVLDPPPRDLVRLRTTEGLKVIDGPENRLIFVGFDQLRDQPLYVNAPDGKNPFKDLRVRRALYQAIDIEAIKLKLMNGQSVPTGGLTPGASGAYKDPQIEGRLPFDLAAARKLMQEAGYADGFEFTLDCPNNRYVNDEKICLALASMWAQLKVKVKVNAMPRVTFFPKIEKLETSAYLYGWGGGVMDPEIIMTPVFRNRGEKGVGAFNYGWRDDKFDALAAQSSLETDPSRREDLVKAALTEFKQQIHVIPLHRQMIPWAMRSNVTAVPRPDNALKVEWMSMAQ